MEEEKLKNYLLKAEYLRVVIQGTKKVPSSPLRRVKRRKSSTNFILNRLKGVPYKGMPSQHLALLMKSSSFVELTFDANNSVDSITSNIKTARVADAIEKGRNLHLLYYKMVYFAAQKKSSIKWQRPYRYNAALRLKNMNRFQPHLKKFTAKFSKITSNSQDLLKEGKEILDQNRLALEQEFSDRRNYRISTPLHT